MSDTLVVVGSGGSSSGGISTPPVPSLTSLITPDALSDLRALLLRDEARLTLIGISAIKTLLLAELVEHVRAIGKDQKRLADYFAPPPPACKPAVPPSSDGSTGGPAGSTGATGHVATPASPAAHAAVAEPAPSQFVADFGNRMASVVKMPVDQLRTTVDSQGKAIDKGAAGITELQAAHTASDARLRTLEANYKRLDTAHHGLSDRVVEIGFERGEPGAATEALGEAGSPVRDPGEPIRKTPARPMRQAGTPVRKAQARKKK